MDNYISINIPSNIKIILWEKEGKKKIYLLAENKKLIITLIENKVKIDKWVNSIVIYKETNTVRNEKTEKKVYNFLKSLNLYFFNKIKFKGKGFRIKFFKKIKLIKFYFGRSHKTFIFLKNIKKKKINKYKFILYDLSKKKTICVGRMVNKIKPLNIYTIRGLRSSRQIIYKRKGKKGTYI